MRLRLGCVLWLMACGADPVVPPSFEPATQGSMEVCDDTCVDANDGFCDDGGENADFSVCEFGTDCGDCGPREGSSPNTPTAGMLSEEPASPSEPIVTPNGSVPGDACDCGGTGGISEEYGLCSGTENGCDFFVDPRQSCLYNLGTGAGTCIVSCSESEAGTQGPCGAGSVCQDSGRDDITGGAWYACSY